MKFVVTFMLKFPLTLTYCNGCTYFKIYTLYVKRDTHLFPVIFFLISDSFQYGYNLGKASDCYIMLTVSAFYVNSKE